MVNNRVKKLTIAQTITLDMASKRAICPEDVKHIYHGATVMLRKLKLNGLLKSVGAKRAKNGCLTSTYRTTAEGDRCLIEAEKMLQCLLYSE